MNATRKQTIGFTAGALALGIALLAAWATQSRAGEPFAAQRGQGFAPVPPIPNYGFHHAHWRRWPGDAERAEFERQRREEEQKGKKRRTMPEAEETPADEGVIESLPDEAPATEAPATEPPAEEPAAPPPALGPVEPMGPIPQEPLPGGEGAADAEPAAPTSPEPAPLEPPVAPPTEPAPTTPNTEEPIAPPGILPGTPQSDSGRRRGAPTNTARRRGWARPTSGTRLQRETEPAAAEPELISPRATSADDLRWRSRHRAAAEVSSVSHDEPAEPRKLLPAPATRGARPITDLSQFGEEATETARPAATAGRRPRAVEASFVDAGSADDSATDSGNPLRGRFARRAAPTTEANPFR